MTVGDAMVTVMLGVLGTLLASFAFPVLRPAGVKILMWLVLRIWPPGPRRIEHHGDLLRTPPEERLGAIGELLFGRETVDGLVDRLRCLGVAGASGVAIGAVTFTATARQLLVESRTVGAASLMFLPVVALACLTLGAFLTAGSDRALGVAVRRWVLVPALLVISAATFAPQGTTIGQGAVILNAAAGGAGLFIGLLKEGRARHAAVEQWIVTERATK